MAERRDWRQQIRKWPEQEVRTVGFTKPGRLKADPRKEAVRKRVIVTVLMRQGLTRVEAEEQYELGVR